MSIKRISAAQRAMEGLGIRGTRRAGQRDRGLEAVGGTEISQSLAPPLAAFPPRISLATRSISILKQDAVAVDMEIDPIRAISSFVTGVRDQQPGCLSTPERIKMPGAFQVLQQPMDKDDMTGIGCLRKCAARKPRLHGQPVNFGEEGNCEQRMVSMVVCCVTDGQVRYQESRPSRGK